MLLVVLFLALPVFLTPDFPRSLNIYNSRPTQRDLIAYGLMACSFYLNFFVLIPKFYVTKKYIAFFSIVFLCFIVISLVPLILLPENHGLPQEIRWFRHAINQLYFSTFFKRKANNKCQRACNIHFYFPRLVLRQGAAYTCTYL